MAMVSRKPKEVAGVPKGAEKLGPGSYEPDDKQIKKHNPGWTIGRNQNVMGREKNSTPGPGHYDLPETYISQRVVLCNEREGLIVVEKQKSQANFKSKTPKNSSMILDVTPGPGSYNIQKPSRKPNKSQDILVPEIGALQQIFANSSYRPIASIPHRGMEKLFEEKTEEGVQGQRTKSRILHSGKLEKRARMRMEKNMKPGSSFGRARCPRGGAGERENSDGEGLGPGCYYTEPEIVTRRRGFGIDRTTLNNAQSKGSFLKLLQKHQKQTQKQNPTAATCSITQDSDNDLSVEYIKDAIPGPGSYDLSNLSFGSKSKRNINFSKGFGITEKRFTEPKVYYVESGSGSTAEGTESGIRKVVVRRRWDGAAPVQLAFGRCPKQAERTEEQYKKLGPGSYPQSRSISRNLINNIKNTYQGSFGSIADRFKNQPNNIPSIYPDFYDTQPVPTTTSSKPCTANCVFKSKSPRTITSTTNNNNNNSLPKSTTTTTNSLNFYSQNTHTIQKKVEDIKRQIEDSVVKRPGFNMSTVRFSEPERRKIANAKASDVADPAGAFQRLCGSPKAYSIPVAEIETNVNENPGPGEYNYIDAWNTRTFNVLYI